MDYLFFIHISFLTMLNFLVLLIFHQKISKNEFGIYRVNKFFMQSDNFNIRRDPRISHGIYWLNLLMVKG